jgi:electron-transferring-flavoprotein dehydrogenase
MQYDVIIVGAGPAGLASAIRIKQLSEQYHYPISVCILEKGAYVGAHLLSGALLNPCSLQALLGEVFTQVPLLTPVMQDKFYYLTRRHAIRLPTPKPMRNHGNYMISVVQLAQFLGDYAQQLGCDIYPGFAASELLTNTHGALIGVRTNPVGINQHGEHTAQYQAGLELYAQHTLFAEGCRGELSEQLMRLFNLRDHCQPQTYALGIKERWKIPATQHQLGLVMHTIGWPLDQRTYGGSFLYHLDNQHVALGLVVGLDYSNPWLDPFEEMQRFKTHPLIRQQLQGGERLEYGARALNEGGWQAQPKLTFPGGALIGDAAGFINVPQLKGLHTAIQSGIFAAEGCVELLRQNTTRTEAFGYPERLKRSWVSHELKQTRNIRPGFRYGLWTGLCNAAFETYISHGYSPWTLTHKADHTGLTSAQASQPIAYPKPDGILTFDKLTSVYLSNTHHAPNQPTHLLLRDPQLAITLNYMTYASPETRYCPAGVYELLTDDHNNPRLHINAANCLHCKTCDIKDPAQNIRWHTPEGGGGPNYSQM